MYGVKKYLSGAFLVAQWLRIHLPVQETQVQSLLQEDPTCLRATKPMYHNCGAGALEPMDLSKRSRCNEKPVLSATRESPCTVTKTQHSQKSRNQSIFEVKK